ncbi:NTP transferase domain-containing protein [Azonexus sp.]|uniref:NTP transferase domain-containing protein n=1 Tax=Azonexus sp. TaxID=1872668 RepID=UPI0035B0A873
MEIIKNAVIAAAGVGSRLGHGIPKCMLEIGGKTLLTRLITTLDDLANEIIIVVGYRENLIIDHCKKHHPHVTIINNPAYLTTNTVQSMALGSQGLSGKTIFMDGDLVIKPESLYEFFKKSTKHTILAAISPSQSEYPVHVNLECTNDHDNQFFIKSFTRESGLPYEWANVVSGPPRMLDGASGYVYEKLEEYTPICATPLDLCEIDTESDLAIAKEFVQNLDQN